MVDALRHNAEIAGKKSRIISLLGLQKGDYYVATIHRPGNTDDRKHLSAIMEAFRESGKTVVFPTHPRTKKYLREYGLYDSLPENVRCIEPLGYIDMLHLMSHAKKILTDSGGSRRRHMFWEYPVSRCGRIPSGSRR